MSAGCASWPHLMTISRAVAVREILHPGGGRKGPLLMRGTYTVGLKNQSISAVISASAQGQVSPTRLTVETLMPSAPPLPSRSPVTDTRFPTCESRRVRTNFNAVVLVPSGSVASSAPAPVFSTRTGSVALVSVQSLPLLGARQPTIRTRVLAGNSPGPSFGMIATFVIVSGASSVVPEGKPFDLRISATRSLYVAAASVPP